MLLLGRKTSLSNDIKNKTLDGLAAPKVCFVKMIFKLDLMILFLVPNWQTTRNKLCSSYKYLAVVNKTNKSVSK